MIAKLLHDGTVIGQVLTNHALSSDEIAKLCNIDLNEQRDGDFVYDPDLLTTIVE